jgi:hypothetical protein
MLFVFAMTAGGGELRIFAILGFGIGMTAYFLTLSAAARIMCGTALDLSIRLVKLILSPFIVTVKTLIKIYKFSKNLFHFHGKRGIMYFESGSNAKIRERYYKRGVNVGETEEETARRAFDQARHRSVFGIHRSPAYYIASSKKRTQAGKYAETGASRRGKNEKHSSVGNYRL